jgi:hypothetical protein
MNNEKKYHLFYIYPSHPRHEAYDSSEELLRKVKALKDGDVSFHVIFGVELEFEPAKVVEAWRFKE